MRSSRWVHAALATALGIGLWLPVYAHHSFSAFNMEEERTVTGMVRQVEWTNPHIWIWLDVPNDQGGVDVYGFEGMSPNYLARRGWTRRTLEPGTEISVAYRPLRSGENGGMFVSTELPDGQQLRMFGSPTDAGGNP